MEPHPREGGGELVGKGADEDEHGLGFAAGGERDGRRTPPAERLCLRRAKVMGVRSERDEGLDLAGKPGLPHQGRAMFRLVGSERHAQRRGWRGGPGGEGEGEMLRPVGEEEQDGAGGGMRREPLELGLQHGLAGEPLGQRRRDQPQSLDVRLMAGFELEAEGEQEAPFDHVHHCLELRARKAAVLERDPQEMGIETDGEDALVGGKADEGVDESDAGGGGSDLGRLRAG
jgi:hypothetical protein